ncbi:MAG: CDP-glucose 4,6-dehydratase [Betaproteobacteria bacterium]|nr:CDP-glucose 4,6-dehydratase [Betaproteobacteria bacterium]
MSDPAIWSGRKVLLTGHTGFKGGWLALWLQHMGADILGYSLAPPTLPNMYEVAEVGKGMRTVFGDIRDLDKLSKQVAEFGPEIVFHLAAQSLVRPSYTDPVGTYGTNVMGTVNVLEAVRATSSVKAVVVVTSDKCYENKEWAWGYRESDPLGGFDPYSNSKGCAEFVTAAYRQSFFSRKHAGGRNLPVASARAGNVIGGGDWATDRLVPDFVRAMTREESIRIRNPHAQRPWQHVLEPLSGYIRLAERLLGSDARKYASAWNFGPDDVDTITVAEVVKKLTARWGPRATFTIDTGDQPHEASFLKLDCAKARMLLGWRPSLDVDTALDWTVEWHKAMSAGANMRNFSSTQIARFQSFSALDS